LLRPSSIAHFFRNRHRVSAAGLDLLIERTSAQLRQISGVADAGIKPGVVASRVAAELLARGEPSLSQLLDSAEGGDATAKTELRNLLTVNYSCFWREPEHWPILAEHLCLRIQSGAPLRMWSAACARGEEAWTMALVAAEVALRFPTLAPHWDWQVLGTDIDTPSLDAAQIARYTLEELGPLPPRMRTHLLPSGSDTAPRWDVPAALRDHVHFRQLDLAQAQWQLRRDLPEQCADLPRSRHAGADTPQRRSLSAARRHPVHEQNRRQPRARHHAPEGGGQLHLHHRQDGSQTLTRSMPCSF
jgi:chemotaxis methyl-accepting protein methylase